MADILEQVQQKQSERMKGVAAYSVTREMMGQRITEYYRQVEVELEDGTVYPVSQRAQATDVQCPGAAESMKMTPEALDAYAEGLEMTGDAVSSGVEDGLENAGLPRGLFNGMGKGGDAWATTDMRRMTGGMAAFARGAAEAEKNNAAQAEAGTAESAELANQMQSFARDAKLVGSEKIDGRNAFHLQADGLDQVQESGGQTFTMQTMSMWIDSEEYVPLRMKIDGIATSGKESRPISIEKLDQDYRHVPDSDMYESYQQVLRIGGMLDKAQQKEMQKAQQQMAEFEQQMAAMPASQRQMMEKMMGSQLETMRKMAAGGGFETVTTIEEIKVLPLLTAAECGAGKADGD